MSMYEDGYNSGIRIAIKKVEERKGELSKDPDKDDYAHTIAVLDNILLFLYKEIAK